MKKIIIALLVTCTTLLNAQEFVSCNTYTGFGDYEKAKACMNSLKSKYQNDPAFCYYHLQLALNSNDATLAKTLMGTINSFPQDNMYVRAAVTCHDVYMQNIQGAKMNYEGVLKNHKTVPAELLIDVARSFIRYKSRDAEYTLLWIKTLEKELKAPHAGWLMLKGDYYSAVGDHGNAMNFYNQVLDTDAGNAMALYKKALAYRRIKNPNAALDELELALRSKPEFPLAVKEKGEVLLELNRADEGIACYNNYFTMAPSDILAHLQFGSALFSLKKYAEAESQASFVLAADPANSSAMKLKSYALYEQARYPEGLDLIRTYIEKTDPSAILSKDYEYLAHFYQKTGSDSMAVESFKKAITLPGAKSELFSEAGSLMVKKSRFEDAAKTYQSKLERYSGTSADYYNFGRSALAMENYVLADSLFKKVCEMQPTWPNGFLMRANTNAHLDPGSTEGKALTYYEKYTELAEADSVNASKYKSGLIESYKYLGYYHYLRKNVEASRTYWKKVLALDPEDKQANDVLKQL